MKNGKTIIILAAALWMFQAKPAAAQFLTGADLLALCTSSESRKVYSCMNYVAGVIDYHVVMQSLGTAPTKDYCLPENLPLEAATVTVMTYLKKSPMHQAFIAAPAITMALSEKYPCVKQQPKKKKKKKK